ncbi:biotin--[acetyl-CoA-carboxylase] ligase [Chryseotalea sanaruensis]|uniref:biotin--[biotin carboxyl-carrier protein] ligase n=1 Tax=Chryseotalea sanaruensis TaxID=2482724 RepID=A0A401U951_9BACT|nr:biotin--[acetyl-CoA-carboxylase] ligase [Chryseotalea sanaruensis]GCC51428.1 biotin--[acetyl-CoA-carboxylase] ligase [Chryseotalea sanaruensis]
MYKTVENTLFIGKKIVFVPTCTSTNDLAIKLLQQPAAVEGTIVVTDSQTAGRGQRGNQWQTEPGQNLTLSIILKPVFLAIKDQFYLTMVTALATYDFLKTQSPIPAQIKWPNDILIGGKKMGGILIENQLQGDSISSAVIGIGLNINQKDFVFHTATSLSLVAQHDFTLQEIFALLLSHIESRYLMLRNGHHDTLKRDYLQNLFQLNESANYLHNDQQFTGIIRGIDAWGKLIIETEQGMESFDLKEVSFL